MWCDGVMAENASCIHTSFKLSGRERRDQRFYQYFIISQRSQSVPYYQCLFLLAKTKKSIHVCRENISNKLKKDRDIIYTET